MKLTVGKLIGFCVLILGVQYLLYALVSPRWLNFPAMGFAFQAIKRGVPVYYFGDSVNATISEEDRDRRSISEMLEGELSRPVGGIAQPGLSLATYREFIPFILAHGGDPKTIVLPINLRSIVASTSSGYSRENALLKLGRNPWVFPFAQALLTFHAIELEKDLPEKTFPEGMQDGRQVASVGRYMESLYGDPIVPTQTQVRAIDGILEDHRGADFRLIFYFTPINVEKGTRVLGEAFRGRVRKNVEFVRGRMDGANGVTCLDLSEAVPEDQFLDVEHLKEGGRRLISREVARLVDAGPDEPDGKN